MLSLERPQQWDHQNANDPEEQVERNTDAKKVFKAVASWSVNHGVRLVAHWCGESRASRHSHRDEQGGESTGQWQIRSRLGESWAVPQRGKGHPMNRSCE